MTGRSVMCFPLARRLRRTALAAALALGTLAAAGLSAGTAEAGVASPMLAASVPADAASALPVENVRWVCGPWRCAWRPNWNYWYVPPYARGWGPPLRPNCFWRRGWGGWVHVCP